MDNIEKKLDRVIDLLEKKEDVPNLPYYGIGRGGIGRGLGPCGRGLGLGRFGLGRRFRFKRGFENFSE